MTNTTPDHATRITDATERAKHVIERMSARNWAFDREALQQLSHEAEQAFVVSLIGQGRVTMDELRAFVAEYRATQLEAAFQQMCTQPKPVRLARLG